MCSVRKVNDLLGEKIKMESVEVKELSFAYENTDTLILKDLNMQIQEGDAAYPASIDGVKFFL